MMKIVKAEPMSAVMERAEVMHIAKMAAGPVSGIEVMPDARMAHGPVAQTSMSNSSVPTADVRTSTAKHMRNMSCIRRWSLNMASARMVHTAVTDGPMRDSGMTTAEVRATANMMTAAVSPSSHMNASAMSSAVTTVSSMPSANVSTAGMSTSSMSSPVLREKWIRQKDADACTQQDCEQDCGSLAHPDCHAGLRLHI